MMMIAKKKRLSLREEVATGVIQFHHFLVCAACVVLFFFSSTFVNMSETLVGYAACAIAIICFGSNFVPAKKVHIGDGVFFQFIMCNAIFFTSFPVYAVQGIPSFHPLAMMGGALWCTGNMMCGPIIQLIGMGMGLLIWGCANMLMGWASGTFGLFGLSKDDIKTPAYNYVGIVIVVVGMYVFLQVKTNEMHSSESPGDDMLYKHVMDVEDHHHDHESDNHLEPKGRSMSMASVAGFHQINDDGAKHFGHGWSQAQKRVIGLSMAIAAGLMFGASFNPAQYVIDNRFDGDDNSLNYVFPHFCGIWVASWSYMLMYAAYKYFDDDVLYVNPHSILPAAMAGAMWGAACIAWFVANGKLGFSIAFPLITSGPGFIGSMYGIFLFEEISGKKNFMILGAAFAVTLTGLGFIASSH